MCYPGAGWVDEHSTQVFAKSLALLFLDFLAPRKIVNTVVMCRGRAYFLKSTEVVSNSGEQYYAVALEAKKFLESHGIQVVATVGDNAQGVQNALQRCAVVLCCLL